MRRLKHCKGFRNSPTMGRSAEIAPLKAHNLRARHSAVRLRAARDGIDKRHGSSAPALAALAPWRGDAEALASTRPSEAETAELRRRASQATALRQEALKVAKTGEPND